MRGLIITGLSVLVLSACGGQEPAQKPETIESSEPVGPVYAESDECREGAVPVLDAIELAVDAQDVRELTMRVDAVDALASDLSTCSARVSGPANAAIESLGKAVVAAQWDLLGGGSTDTANAYVEAQEARKALDATL